MSESINVGDMVMLVRGHPCAVEYVGGIPFLVTELHAQTGGGWTCGICGTRDLAPEAPYGVGGAPKPNVAVTKRGPGPYGGLPVTWLKRIPPLEELERADPTTISVE